MTRTVCLASNALDYPAGGGHLWVFLNWALGLRSLGCEVVWFEGVDPHAPVDGVRRNLAALKARLARYDLDQQVALYSQTDAPLSRELADGVPGLDDVAGADLLLSLEYTMRRETVGRFRRTAFVDIDPGEVQTWLDRGELYLAPHDLYFTIGETVGQPGARFPDAGLTWHYTPPCVALDWWPPRRAPADAPFTTVAHWYGGWMEDPDGGYDDAKRDGFLPFLDVPRLAPAPIELAIDLVPDDSDNLLLWEHGWRVVDSAAVAATPWDYQRYIQASRGEFSCAKPHCVRLQNAWISDRSLCYLASGKPVVVQHTGPSRFLPEAAGLFRFRTPEQAAHHLRTVAADYDHQCHLARQLAAEHFDARLVVGRVLERALA